MPDPMVQVLIRMPKDMHDAVRRLAEENDRTMAAEVRRALRGHIEGALSGRTGDTDA